MKNNIILTGLLFFLLVATGCDTDEYEPPYDDYSSFAWYTSELSIDNIEDSDYAIAVRDTITFVDLSQNALSHEWTKPESAKFISVGAAREHTVNIQFMESGIHEVRLKNVFKDSVPNAVRVGQNWEIEKIFTVDVFADVAPAFKVLKGTEEVISVAAGYNPKTSDSSTWPTITLEAGEQLTYIDLTEVGRPDARTWTLNGGSPESSNAESATIGYYGLGTFEAGSVLVKRNDSEKPDGETTKLIPLKIKVIPSTQPFEQVGQIKENESEVLTFSVTGQIDTLTGEEDNFTVHVVNSAAGFDQNIAVQSATINSEDPTKIDLVLSEPIYNSDEITVSYTAGNIVSVDTRVLESFGPVNVKMHENDNVLDLAWSGFEVASTNWKKAFCEGYWVGNGNNEASPIFARTDAMFYSGVASMKYESADGITNATIQGSNFTKGGATPHGIPTLPAGTYKVSFMVYLEEGNTTQSFTTILQNDDNIVTVWDVSTLPRGEWVEMSYVITTTADSTNKKFNIKLVSGDNSGVTGKQIMYFDDLAFRPIEIRQ